MRFRLFIVLLSFCSLSCASPCTGSFVNPVNLCWKCLFPITIGNSEIVRSTDLKDTVNPTNPIGICGTRVGLNIGFWEPFSIVDVTDTPYCLVNLGGHKLDMGIKQGKGGVMPEPLASAHAFYHVHWYKYPVIAWLNLILSAGCHEMGDFDVAYMSELDPSWRNSRMSFVLNPEAILFSNPIAQAACAADSISVALLKRPKDSLYWCAGSQGSMYPLSGHVSAPVSPIQSALLLAERMNFKLHREPLIEDSTPVGKDMSVCQAHHYPVLPKSRYRYELVNQVQDGKHCYPYGYPTLAWEAGKIKPNQPHQFGFLMWRKRNCTYL